jgi:hypothetical protein
MTCILCGDDRVICPGCTGGHLGSDLFMGCGVYIRCPRCVGYGKALKDKEFMKSIYWPNESQTWDDITRMQKEYYAEMLTDLVEQFPEDK